MFLEPDRGLTQCPSQWLRHMWTSGSSFWFIVFVLLFLIIWDSVMRRFWWFFFVCFVSLSPNPEMRGWITTVWLMSLLIQILLYSLSTKLNPEWEWKPCSHAEAKVMEGHPKLFKFTLWGSWIFTESFMVWTKAQRPSPRVQQEYRAADWSSVTLLLIKLILLFVCGWH